MTKPKQANTTGAAKGAGRSTRKWREKISPELLAKAKAEPHRCWLCGMTIDYTIEDVHNDEVFEPYHVYPVNTYPERAEDPLNLRASHRRCNGRRGNGHTPAIPQRPIPRLVGRAQRVGPYKC
jgi:hypothetical protein